MTTILLSFWTIFIAELGDKTQLAIISLTAAKHNPLLVWIGTTVAFCVLNLLAVIIGSSLTKFVPVHYLKYANGILFIIIGIVTIVGKK